MAVKYRFHTISVPERKVVAVVLISDTGSARWTELDPAACSELVHDLSTALDDLTGE